MNSHYTYFVILASSLAGPLVLSFDSKVAFYRNWKFLFPAMVIPGLLYLGWDIFFTSNGVWSFNEQCVTGIKLNNLPVEEVLFFVIVPYCCVFIYACIRFYFPGLTNKRTGDAVLQMLALGLGGAGIIFYKRYYTSWTFLLNALFIALIYLRRNYFKYFDATSFLVSWLLTLIPFLIVNGFLTGIPVVLYNNAENLGIRIYTIPFEDVFYGMLLVLMNIVIYENLKKDRTQRSTEDL